MCSRSRGFVAAILVLSAMAGACATSPSPADTENSAIQSAGDPWEIGNRGVYAVNRELDRFTLKPVAKVYRKVMPVFVRRGVGNFFANLRVPLTIVNQVLQGKGRVALSDSGRFLINSTIGIGGLFDPATAMHLEEHREDFGQTLAVWGVPDGPFVMVPLIGPRNLRDAVSLPVDLIALPLFQYEDTSVRDKLLGLDAVSVRARLLAGESLINDSADPYITIRDAYQQNRRYLVHDGEPPEQDYELYDDFVEQDPQHTNEPGDLHE